MYEIYTKLRDARGFTDYRVSEDTGVSRSTFTDWKNGKSVPKTEKLQKIADYFDVSIDYLLTGKSEKLVYANSETAQMAQEIKDSKELTLLFNAARDAKPEDLKTTYEMLLALKRKEQNG